MSSGTLNPTQLNSQHPGPGDVGHTVLARADVIMPQDTKVSRNTSGVQESDLFQYLLLMGVIHGRQQGTHSSRIYRVRNANAIVRTFRHDTAQNTPKHAILSEEIHFSAEVARPVPRPTHAPRQDWNLSLIHI